MGRKKKKTSNNISIDNTNLKKSTKLLPTLEENPYTKIPDHIVDTNFYDLIILRLICRSSLFFKDKKCEKCQCNHHVGISQHDKCRIIYPKKAFIKINEKNLDHEYFFFVNKFCKTMKIRYRILGELISTDSYPHVCDVDWDNLSCIIDAKTKERQGENSGSYDNRKRAKINWKYYKKHIIKLLMGMNSELEVEFASEIYVCMQDSYYYDNVIYATKCLKHSYDLCIKSNPIFSEHSTLNGYSSMFAHFDSITLDWTITLTNPTGKINIPGAKYCTESIYDIKPYFETKINDNDVCILSDDIMIMISTFLNSQMQSPSITSNCSIIEETKSQYFSPNCSYSKEVMKIIKNDPSFFICLRRTTGRFYKLYINLLLVLPSDIIKLIFTTIIQTYFN